MRTPFSHGQAVVIKARKGKKESSIFARFQEMQTKARAIVNVDPVTPDDDGIRIVNVASLEAWYNAPSDMQRRAKHAGRLFKQGIRMFRLLKDGPTVVVTTVDHAQGIAVVRKLKRKTVQIVPLHDLWPEIRS